MNAGAVRIKQAIPDQSTKLRQCEAVRSELDSVDVGLGTITTVEHWQGLRVPMRLLRMLIHASWAVFLSIREGSTPLQRKPHYVGNRGEDGC